MIGELALIAGETARRCGNIVKESSAILAGRKSGEFKDSRFCGQSSSEVSN